MAGNNATIEITIRWAGTALDSIEWTGGELCVGRSFSFPEGVLSPDHALIVERDGAPVLVTPPGAHATANGASGEPVAVPCDGLALEAGMSATVALGESFELRVEANADEDTLAPPPRTVGSYRWTRWVGVAAVLHAIVLGMFALLPPGASALNLSGTYEPTRYVDVNIAALAEDPPEPIATSRSGGGEAGQPAGEEGGTEALTLEESGNPAEHRDHGRLTPPRTITADQVNNLGALPTIAELAASFGDNTSPFTSGNATAGDFGNGTAELLAMPGGPDFGGLRGMTAGVGTCDPRFEDCGSQLIHNDRFHTRGGDYGPGTLGPRVEPNGPPPIRPGTPTTVGSLSREQVRRTVRRHLNEVRFCYEQGLQRQPSLEGRVAVEFIISQSGAVQSTNIASSTVSDARVDSCVTQAVSRWSFPSSAAPTGVTYPFMMQSN